MKFVITERIPTYQTWTYEVEANSETEALEMVLNESVAATEIVMEEPDWSLAEYEIEDEDGNVFDVEKDEDEEDNDNTQDDDDDEDHLSSVMFGVDNKQ
jgi:hypothetical protein